MFFRFQLQRASDEMLVVALQKGRHSALEELYRRYAEPVRRYFFRMTGQDVELARDYCQDLFVRVAEKAGAFDPDRRFRTWLFSMAHNMCKNHYRHQEVLRSAHAELGEQEVSLPAASVLAQVDAGLLRERIEAALEEVDVERRSTFVLRHREGLSLAEIAEVQGCPVGTVKSRLHHVHRFLASQLADLKSEILPEDGTIRR